MVFFLNYVGKFGQFFKICQEKNDHLSIVTGMGTRIEMSILVPRITHS